MNDVDRIRAAAQLRAAAQKAADAEARVFVLVQVVRVAGGSWAQVGAALGVSRQAARQRFGAAELTAQVGR